MKKYSEKSYNEMYIPLVALSVTLVMLVSFLVGLFMFPRVEISVNENGISGEVSQDGSNSGGEGTGNNNSEPSNENSSVPDSGNQGVSSPQINKETKYYQDFDFTEITVNNSEVGNGSLAIIKTTNKYHPNVKDEDLLNIYANKSKTYELSGVALDLHKDAFKSFDELLSKYYDSLGSAKLIINKAYLNKNEGAATNGSLDLSTGYSIEILSISEDKANFLREQGYKYGIVQRYPTGKDSYTGYAGNILMYRFVGYAHSYYMNYYKYCLEEYLDKLKTEAIIEFKSGIENNVAYAVYYVPVNVNTTTTTLQVPTNENCTYTISGDGSEGFVVAVRIAQ